MKPKALILGLGVSGVAAARFLLQKGFEVLGVDRHPRNIDGICLFSETSPPALQGIELAVISPGIPETHPLLQSILQENIECIGEVELALRSLPTTRIIGVTGSNGKTTTVLLLEHLFSMVGIPAMALGNVGRALTEYALHAKADEVVILELSSFQLERLRTRALEMAFVLNLTPNHLDRHGSMEAYATAKLSIQHLVRPGGTFWVNERVAKQWPLKAPYEVLPFVPHMPASETFQAVCQVARHFSISLDAVEKACASFRKPPHRIEFVAERHGIMFYNDSKATNIDAVMHAVYQLKGPLLVLAGGVDKGASYLPWVEAFRGKVKKMFLFGRAAPLIEAELSPFLAYMRVETLEQAVAAAFAEAERGDTILLSPGCASYDQFLSFEHRGEEYRKIVRRI